MNKKIMVVGGSGFIGKNLINLLIKNNNNVINLDKKTFYLNSNRYKYVKANINRHLKIQNLFDGIDTVFYLQSTSTPGTEISFSKDYTDNILTLINILNNLIGKKIKFIFISSAGAIYGDTDKKNNERHVTNPKSIYGIHKLLAEKYLFFYKLNYGLKYYIARVSNPYDYNYVVNNGIGIVEIFRKKIINSEMISVYGDGNNLRDFIHINDVTDCLLKILYYKGSEIIFNIASGQSYSINQIIIFLEKSLGLKARIKYTCNRNVDIVNNRIDISLAKRELNFKPSYSLKKFIADMK